ncbi:MAG: hypothetical protein ACREX6_03000, partial [Casimicrobiaceae bacterium]
MAAPPLLARASGFRTWIAPALLSWFVAAATAHAAPPVQIAQSAAHTAPPVQTAQSTAHTASTVHTAETPARSADDVPRWFASSFLDFRDDLADATRANKRLLIYIGQEGCPYCRRLLAVDFAQREIVEAMHAHFV